MKNREEIFTLPLCFLFSRVGFSNLLCQFLPAFFVYWNGHSKNIIGNRLKELRTAQGISQKTLAARLQTEGFEFTDLTILRIEQGKRFVPDYEIVAIANYFHISTDYLLGATDIK